MPIFSCGHIKGLHIMERKKLPKGIVRTSFHVLQENTKNCLDGEIMRLECILRWLNILYDDEEEEEKVGEMAFFIFVFARKHPDLLSHDLLKELEKKQTPIRESILRSKKK